MPDDLKNKWKTYRQQLRDLPAKMQAASVHPNIADMMFPMTTRLCGTTNRSC